MGKLTVFNRFLEIFAEKYGSFRPKIVERKICPLRRGGGLKALVDCPLKKNLFFAASLTITGLSWPRITRKG